MKMIWIGVMVFPPLPMTQLYHYSLVTRSQKREFCLRGNMNEAYQLIMEKYYHYIKLQNHCLDQGLRNLWINFTLDRYLCLFPLQTHVHASPPKHTLSLSSTDSDLARNDSRMWNKPWTHETYTSMCSTTKAST